MILLPDWEPLHVSGIFTPAILICGREKETQEKEKFRNLGTYRELFYENGVLQKRVILLGEAGAGKTTFSKHLTDLWCEPRTQQQFADVTVIKEFRYFFYVSCRFAKEGDIIADMIKDQIFGDDKLKAVATYMLEHYPECCLILLDGADEWKGSPTSDTGRRGDIAGLPGMEGVEHCVILITSRPWRFLSLPTRSRSIFRRFQINGIEDVQVLADRILQKLEYPDPAESSYEFLRQVSQNNMYELMKTPMILIIALGGWVNDKSFHKSMCINYINMIQSFIRRSKGQAGWSSSKSKLQQLIPNLETLETGWETKANELPHLLLRYKSIRRYAGLCLLLGELAFDLLLGKEEQSLVFSKKVLKSYLPADDENDESVNVCLALGILSKAETTTRGLRKLESYAFCHKTFQEFFAALWLASKYSNEKSKLYKCLKSYRDLMSYEILISFLCGFDPEAGKRFWMFVAEAVEIVEEDDKDAIERERLVKDVTDLVSKCMKEHGFDQKGQMSDQLYYCIPHIVVYNNTSNEDIMLLCHVMEEYPCSLKSLCVKYCQTLCSGLQKLKLSHLPSVNENSDSLISSVQKHNKRKKRRLFYCLCCLSSTSKNSDSENSDSEHRHSLENLPSVSEHRDSEHSESEHSDSEHSDSLSSPVLDLQKHDKLETLWLQHISIEGLLLPVEGARITSLELRNVTMSHHGREQLSESLSSCSHLEDLVLIGLRCREHRDSCRILVLALQKHDKLKKLWLKSLSIEGLLLPVEGGRITSLTLNDVTMTHHGCEQLSGSLSSGSSLEYLYLERVRGREHKDCCCIPVLDLQKHDKLKKLWLKSLTIECMLLPVEGARITSLTLINVTMPHHDWETLSGSLSSGSSLEYLYLERVRCREHWYSCCIPVLDLQKHDKLEKLELKSLSIEGLLLPVEGARITSLTLINVTMSHHGCEQLSGSLSSGSSLEYLYLERVRCREHWYSCCIPVLDLQKHDKLEKLELKSLSIEGLLLPVEGARITSLTLINVTMSHHGCEQLSGSLSSGSSLEYLYLERVRCREHWYSCCIPVLDLQKHDKLEKLELWSLSIEGLLLPWEGARITSLTLINVTMSHHGCEQLSAAFSSRPEQENWRPFVRCAYDKVICKEHSDSSCQAVKDITNFIESHRQ